MTLAQLISQLRGQMATKLAQRNKLAKDLAELRTAETVDEEKVTEIRGQKEALDAEVDTLQGRVADYEAEQARDDEANRLAREVNPTGERLPAYDGVARVGQEARTYSPDTDKKGMQFLRDVTNQFLTGDPNARERLARHMQEEHVERGGDLVDRATGTGAFTGLVVPQYLTDLFAPMARAGRPTADAMRHHDLPATGMTVNIGRLTTGTDAGLQASENSAVTEQDADDTLLTLPVKTNAGQQTISRQGIERGAGVEDTTLEDLFRAYGVRLDSTLLNEASTGLTNVATSIAYTDGTPTAAELYPKLLAAPAAVEAALLDQAVGDTLAVMHSRRWYWLQSQLTSTWPLFGQPGMGVQQGGVNYGEVYGRGFRGILPAGTPVIADNNIATNLGAGTNEDEIYTVAQSEAHLWEDPNAPMLIRAEQTKAATLGVLLVVYGYFAYTFGRRPHAQKINGTGLVTPVF